MKALGWMILLWSTAWAIGLFVFVLRSGYSALALSSLAASAVWLGVMLGARLAFGLVRRAP